MKKAIILILTISVVLIAITFVAISNDGKKQIEINRFNSTYEKYKR